MRACEVCQEDGGSSACSACWSGGGGICGAEEVECFDMLNISQIR